MDGWEMDPHPFVFRKSDWMSAGVKVSIYTRHCREGPPEVIGGSDQFTSVKRAQVENEKVQQSHGNQNNKNINDNGVE